MSTRIIYPEPGGGDVVQAFRDAHQAARDALSCLTPDELYRRLFGSEPKQLALPPPEGRP
jgi:hypothetical protein